MIDYTYGWQDYLRVARKRRATIALVTILVLGFALIFTATRPRTETQTVAGTSETVVVQLDPFPELVDQTSVVSVGRERLTILSEEVLDEAAKTLGVGSDGISEVVSVTADSDSGGLLVTAHAQGEASGEEVALAVARTYLELRNQRLTQALSRAERRLRDEITSVRSSGEPQLVAALRISALEGQLAMVEALQATASPGRILTSPSYTETSVTGVTPTPEEPELVAAPVGRPYARNGAAGLVLGLIMGFGFALFLDVVDKRFRSGEEVVRTIGLPILASLPREGGARWSSAVNELAGQVEHPLATGQLRSLAILPFTGKAVSLNTDLGQRLRDVGYRVEQWAADDAPQGAIGLPEARRRLQDADRADLVLIHAPLAGHADTSLTWAGATDQSILVIDMENTQRAEVTREKGNLERAGATLMGVVLLV